MEEGEVINARESSAKSYPQEKLGACHLNIPFEQKNKKKRELRK